MRNRRLGKAWKVLLVCGIVLVCVACVLVAPHVIPPAAHSSEEFGIEPYTSTHDEDGDGIDDQTDILASARDYLATNPRYKSVYYEGGRPNDGQGVCTDVVDQALLGAGYDLQALLDADVRENPDAYDIGTADPNIDFRRVANLRVWFPLHATSLTTDPHDLAAWQGGDIVCWQNHIGIVSDKRNGQGVSLVLHHWGPLQLFFEEDALESREFGPIVGHWRMS